jgi:hypothetical protein
MCAPEYLYALILIDSLQPEAPGQAPGSSARPGNRQPEIQAPARKSNSKPKSAPGLAGDGQLVAAGA